MVGCVGDAGTRVVTRVVEVLVAVVVVVVMVDVDVGVCGVGVGDGGGGGGVDGIDVGVGGDTAHVNALYHARRLITPQINIVWGGGRFVGLKKVE